MVSRLIIGDYTVFGFELNCEMDSRKYVFFFNIYDTDAALM